MNKKKSDGFFMQDLGFTAMFLIMLLFIFSGFLEFLKKYGLFRTHYDFYDMQIITIILQIALVLYIILLIWLSIKYSFGRDLNKNKMTEEYMSGVFKSTAIFFIYTIVLGLFVPEIASIIYVLLHMSEGVEPEGFYLYYLGLPILIIFIITRRITYKYKGNIKKYIKYITGWIYFIISFIVLLLTEMFIALIEPSPSCGGW